jgi:hypothetical protein
LRGVQPFLPEIAGQAGFLFAAASRIIESDG